MSILEHFVFLIVYRIKQSLSDWKQSMTKIYLCSDSIFI